MYNSSNELIEKINGYVVNRECLELLEMRKTKDSFREDLQKTAYLVNLSEGLLWDNYEEVFKRTESSEWRKLSDSTLRDLYSDFKFKAH